MSRLLADAGLLVAAGAAAAAILLPPSRGRSSAMLVALAVAPALILGDQWHTEQIADLRGEGGRVAALLAVALAAIAVLATLFRRWPALLPLAAVFALPFRVPLEAGGDTANLLVPLYLVIAGGAVATALRDAPRAAAVPARPPASGAAVWLPRLLAAVVVLYALQGWYSEGFSKGLQNVGFFMVPFAVMYGLLRDVEWDRRLVSLVLWVVAVEAVAFVAVGGVELATRSLFWNDQVIRSNEFHTYFRVNSVFWDPNIYGRYLALAAVLATAALLWVRTRRDFWLLTGLIAVLWAGLVPTFSQSSFACLLAGLAVLAAIRWSWRWTLAAVAVGAVGAMLVVALAGGSGGLDLSRLNNDTSGRANLVSGGAELFGERPLWGYGSGSFQDAYRNRAENKDVPVSVSHTEPITVAAEQGLLGLAAYLGLIVAALWTMCARIGTAGPARAAVLAAFVALLVHTMAYAGFFEDPITWLLLAAGAALASAPAVRSPA